MFGRPKGYHGSGLQKWHEGRRELAAEREKRVAKWQAENVQKLADHAAWLKEKSVEGRAALVRHHANKRRAAKLLRTPAWADEKAIKALHAEADRLTRVTGIPHHVDHILPLQGRLVSGLHVHQNMQILTASENSRKRNRYEPC